MDPSGPFAGYYTYREYRIGSGTWRRIAAPFGGLLGVWHTVQPMSNRWEIRIEAIDTFTSVTYFADTTHCPDGTTRANVIVKLDEFRPVPSITITDFSTDGGVTWQSALPCDEFVSGVKIRGSYSVADDHFGSLSLTVEPSVQASGATPSPSSRAYPIVPTTGEAGMTALGTLALHAIAAPIGPDIFAQRYLTSLIPLAVALLAGGIAYAPWRWATPVAAVALVGLGIAVFAQRYGRELEPPMAPVRAFIEQSGDRAVVTNSARVAFYLRDMRPRLDRPLGFGADAEEACGPNCPLPLAIVDDARAPAGVRAGPGRTEAFGPLHVRLRPSDAEPAPGGVQWEGGSADVQLGDAGRSVPGRER